MRVYSSLLFLGLFFLSGCSVLNKNLEEVSNTKVPINKSLKLNKEKIVETKSLKNVEVILNVFDDEFYFEKDKAVKNKRKLVIKYLDAAKWEKQALRKIYAKHKRIWSRKQYRDLQKILEEDKYASLCSDRRYWDHLKFEEEEPQRDILKSILLLRYINNLSYGCSHLLFSNGKSQHKNFKKHIDANYIFSLLPHEVLIDKLLLQYVPNKKLNIHPDYIQ